MTNLFLVIAIVAVVAFRLFFLPPPPGSTPNDRDGCGGFSPWG